MSTIPGVTDAGPLKGFNYDKNSGAFIYNSGSNDKYKLLQRRVAFLEEKVRMISEKLEAVTNSTLHITSRVEEEDYDK